MATNITSKLTDVDEFMEDLYAGVFKAKLSRALSDVAAGVIDHGRAGKMVITLDIKQIGDSAQVAINHNLAYTKPTAKGKIAEDDTTQSVMHVGVNGSMSMFPENQEQLFDKKGNPVNEGQQEHK